MRGDREAATVTYHGFLSFFPLVVVGFAILSYLSGLFPGLRAGIERQIEATFPGMVGDGPGQINLDAIANSQTGVGLVGLALLLYTGSMWVSSLREAVHAMWTGERDGGPTPIIGKLTDVSVLALLGLVTLGSVAVSGGANWIARQLVDLLGAAGPLATFAGRVTLTIASVAINTVLFAVMYWRLAGRTIRPQRLWSGALLASVGFEILRLAASLLLGHTLQNPIYTSFAMVVALLLWINFSTRVILLAAAWSATGPASRADLRTDLAPTRSARNPATPASTRESAPIQPKGAHMPDRAASVVFDRIAEEYDETRGGESRAQAVATMLARQLPADYLVLEIGVGTGIVASALAERGFSIVGVDLSVPMLRKAQERLGSRVVNGDALRLPIASHSVHTAYSVWVLHLVADVRTAFAEIARVLVSGGELVVIPSVEHDADDLSDVTVLTRPLIEKLRPPQDRPQRLTVLAAEAGLGLVSEETFESEVYEESPNAIAERIERRIYSALWDVDDATWQREVIPVVSALRALPEPARPRQMRNTNALLTFQRR